MESVEKEFEDFFNYCSNQGFTTDQMTTICQPLKRNERLKKFKWWTSIIIIFGAIYLLCNWLDWFSWPLSAIGRLVLVQLLPYWNWTPLYKAKCVIERPLDAIESKSMPSLGKYEADKGNCALCESLERIPTTSNVTFSFLEFNYLERGLPVIIADSHEPKTLDNFLFSMQSEALDFMQSDPCDVSSNLMLRKLFDLDLALQKIKMNPSNEWFLHLRNCQFRAVKSSRIFVTRPYYYPKHLEPFYSSWVLMSHNYNGRERALYLNGLVFVQQLSGYFDVCLRPKQPCADNCPMVNIRLGAGEGLVFSTDLWMLSYGTQTIKSKVTSIATILEIDWQL